MTGLKTILHELEQRLFLLSLAESVREEERNQRQLIRAVKAASGWRCERCDRQCYRPEDAVQTRRDVLTCHRRHHDPKENFVAWCAPCQLRENAPYYARLRKQYHHLKRIECYGQIPFSYG